MDELQIYEIPNKGEKWHCSQCAEEYTVVDLASHPFNYPYWPVMMNAYEYKFPIEIKGLPMFCLKCYFSKHNDFGKFLTRDAFTQVGILAPDFIVRQSLPDKWFGICQPLKEIRDTDTGDELSDEDVLAALENLRYSLTVAFTPIPFTDYCSEHFSGDDDTSASK